MNDQQIKNHSYENASEYLSMPSRKLKTRFEGAVEKYPQIVAAYMQVVSTEYVSRNIVAMMRHVNVQS
jgi:hypothetical protein